ncbi:MAG: hypothetical protein ACYCST_03370 [Acidimicrobiales bacterium]
MARKVVIVGGGTEGTILANRLRRAEPPDELEIVVVDQDDRHAYQPGSLFVPFGLAKLDEITRPRGHQLHRGVTYRPGRVDRVDPRADRCTWRTAPASATTLASAARSKPMAIGTTFTWSRAAAKTRRYVRGKYPFSGTVRVQLAARDFRLAARPARARRSTRRRR